MKKITPTEVYAYVINRAFFRVLFVMAKILY